MNQNLDKKFAKKLNLIILLKALKNPEIKDQSQFTPLYG